METIMARDLLLEILKLILGELFHWATLNFFFCLNVNPVQEQKKEAEERGKCD